LKEVIGSPGGLEEGPSGWNREPKRGLKDPRKTIETKSNFKRSPDKEEGTPIRDP